jgi:hypothetical protein
VAVLSVFTVVSVVFVGIGDQVKHHVSNANRPMPAIDSINFFIVIEVRI